MRQFVITLNAMGRTRTFPMASCHSRAHPPEPATRVSTSRACISAAVSIRNDYTFPRSGKLLDRQLARSSHPSPPISARRPVDPHGGSRCRSFELCCSLSSSTRDVADKSFLMSCASSIAPSPKTLASSLRSRDTSLSTILRRSIAKRPNGMGTILLYPCQITDLRRLPARSD